MIRRICRSRRNDDGAVAVLVAILSVVLFGFGALVIDIGHAQVVRSQAQSTVDTASLAGVRVLANGGSTSDVVAAVKGYVDENMGIKDPQWAGCTDPGVLTPADSDPTDTCISTLTSSPRSGITSYQVRVKLPTQHVPATFGGLFGVSSIGISPVAQALSGQPLPPECGPCAPALDETTGQPQVDQSQLIALRQKYQGMLPDPNKVPLAGPLDPINGTGCPTTPGRFTPTDFPMGVTISPNAVPATCILHPGLYVFVDVNLDVAVAGSLASSLADHPPINPGDPPQGTGVTLIFYGTATLTVEGHIGTIDLQDNTKRDPLIATKPAVVWQPGQPIPGVAIVFDQFGSPPTLPNPPGCPSTRCFSLGDDFTIAGSVYALDGQTTWTTNPGDCRPAASACVVHDFSDGQSVLATTATAFSEPDANGIGRIPTIATDHPMAEPPPSPPHLVK